jgi:hypothetical protein
MRRPIHSTLRLSAFVFLFAAISEFTFASDFCDTQSANGADGESPQGVLGDSPVPGDNRGGDCKQAFHSVPYPSDSGLVSSAPRSRSFTESHDEKLELRICGLKNLIRTDGRELDFITLSEISFTSLGKIGSDYSLLLTAVNSAPDTFILQADVYRTGDTGLSVTDPQSPPATSIYPPIVLGTLESDCDTDHTDKRLLIDFRQEGSIILNLSSEFPTDSDSAVTIAPPGTTAPLLLQRLFSGPLLTSTVRDGILHLSYIGVYDPIP